VRHRQQIVRTAVDHEHHALLAWLEMLNQCDQFLDLGPSRLRGPGL
jgi:hypothetical protein